MSFSPISRASWDILGSRPEEAIHSRNYLYAQVAEFGGLGWFLGRAKADHSYVLMLKASEELTRDKDFPATKGLEYLVDAAVLAHGQIGIVLKLQNTTFLDVFVALANDIGERLGHKATPSEVVQEFFTRLGLWKHFLDKGSQNGLGPEKRRGLFGELYFLEQVVIPRLGNSGLSAWVGPTGAMHDFEFGRFAIEVKTSAGNKSQRVTISNERQLDDAGYEHLFLNQYALTVRKGARPSLVDQVEAVERLLDSDQNRILEFHTLLLQAGYHKMHNDFYMKEGYHVSEHNIYRVNNDFPRLIGSDLANGIGGLRYKVDLSSCARFRVGVDDLVNHLTGSSRRKGA